MLSTDFGLNSYRLVVIITLALFSSPTLSAQEQSGMAAQESDLSRYVECHNILNSEPLNELSQYVAEGWGSRIDDSELGKPLIGVACSDAQIINYMEHHGFVRGVLFTWPKPKEHGLLGPYNKLLKFHTIRKSWLQRKLYGESLLVADFLMLNDTILDIASAAHK